MLTIEVINAHRRYRVGKRSVAGYVRRVLTRETRRRATVRVIFVDSRYCRFLNRTYLAHDDVTDVISFQLEGGKNLEGEVYVNVDRARQQARQYAVSLSNEVARLVIHGTLHLVGYDDRDEKASRRMKAREEKYLRTWFGNSERQKE